MKMNRRKALIGIGSLAVGSGAALGSGAFTTVEASRDVTVQTTSDDSAALGLSSSSSYVNNNASSGVLTIDIGSVGNALNEDAVTTLNEVVTVSNNSADGNAKTVSLASASSPPADSAINDSGTDPAGSQTVNLPVGSSPDTEVELTIRTLSVDNLGGSGTLAIDAKVKVGTEADSNLSYSSTEDLLLIAESDA